MASFFASKILRRFLLGLFLLLCLALGELWFYAANTLARYTHRPLFGAASLADFCYSSDIAGFPFSLRLNCANISAGVQTAAGVILVKAEEAHGQASIFAPNHVLLAVSSPVALEKPDGSPLAKLRHDGMTLDIAWSLRGVAKVDLDASAVDWRPQAPEAGTEVHLRRLKAQAEPSADGDAVKFDFDGDGIAAPTLASLLQSKDFGELSASGRISPAPAAAASWREAVEQWRRQSGSVAIDKLVWRAGDMEARIDGALTLDETHFIAGKLNITAKGAGPLIARLAAPSANGQTQLLLAALLARPTDAKHDAAIRLPLVLAKGQVFLGPFRLPVKLAPIY